MPNLTRLGWRISGGGATAGIVLAAGIAVGLPIAAMDRPFGLLLALVGLAALGAMFVRIDWALYALVFAVYVNFSEVAIEVHGAPSIAKLLFLAVLFLVLLRWALLGERPGATREALGIMLATALVIGLSVFTAGDPERSLDALVTYLKNAALALTVIAILVRGATLTGVVWTAVAAGLFLGGLSTWQVLTGTFEADYGGFSVARVEQIVGEIDSWRLVGPIGDPNFFGQILVVLVPLAWDRMISERRVAWRAIAAVALAACVIAIVYTYSRGALLALVVMFGAYVLAHASKLLRRPGLLAALLGLLAVIAVMAPAQYYDRAQQLVAVVPSQGGALQSADPAIRGRFGEMAVAWQMFIDHPLQGVGARNYEPNFQPYNQRLGLMPRNEAREAHSLYLEIAAEGGLLGLAVFAILVGLLATAIVGARRRFRLASRGDYASMAGALGIGWVGYAVTAAFLHDGYPRYFWLLAGITLALPQVAAHERGGCEDGALPGMAWPRTPRPVLAAAPS